MTADRLEMLTRFAAGFHEAMAKHDFSDSELNLRNFPFECCHQACKLLTMFLFDHGFTDIEKSVGSRPDDREGQHLWIIVEGIVVDITACQFDDTLDRTIVARDSSWHSPLNGRAGRFGREEELLCEFVKRMKSQYASFYEELKLEALRIASE